MNQIHQILNMGRLTVSVKSHHKILRLQKFSQLLEADSQQQQHKVNFGGFTNSFHQFHKNRRFQGYNFFFVSLNLWSTTMMGGLAWNLRTKLAILCFKLVEGISVKCSWKVEMVLEEITNFPILTGSWLSLTLSTESDRSLSLDPK